MKVRIVCYEDIDKWILGKFAKKMCEELNKLGINTDIAKTVDMNADINHHIIYYDYDGKPSTIDTVMVTHIDSLVKFNFLKKQLKNTAMGICMSRQTRDELIESGIPKEKICYINPAHDGIIKPRKIILGMTFKIHNDGRKNENDLMEIIKHINPANFLFKIMGGGWEKIIKSMEEKGFTVEYYKDFNYTKYVDLIQNLDYYIYFNYDEGAMGYVDALSAGVKTIVSPQGYHLDAEGGISFPVNDVNDVIKTLNEIDTKRNILINSVENRTRRDYAIKHVELRKYLLNKDKNTFLLNNKSIYSDGLNSIDGKFVSNSTYAYKHKKIVNTSIKDSILSPYNTIKSLLLFNTPNFIKKIIYKFLKK